MIDTLINPADSPERQTEKLLTIAQVLMRRVEQITDHSGAAYAQFQRASMLEDQVRERTADLERALDLLNTSNSALAEANRATEAARRDLANAIETIREGFALFDATGRMVLCNTRFGMEFRDIHPHLAPGFSFEAYIDLVSRSSYLALPDGESREDWAASRKRRHKEQHVVLNVQIANDRWLQVSEHRTDAGGTVVLQTDITDIIRLERTERGRLLDDQARIVRATLDHIDQGICIFDAGATLVGWNARLVQLLQLPAARLRLGADFTQLLGGFGPLVQFGGGMTAQALAIWSHGREGRPALNFELRRGAEQVLAVFAQEMPDGGFVMSFTDITAEKTALDALSRANETLEARVAERTRELESALASRSRFVAAASHDLLQPLSAAKLFMASAADGDLPPRAREAVEKAQNALVSVEGILDALLNISKLESGKAAVSVGPVRIDWILAQLRDEFEPMAAAKGLGLALHLREVFVLSDPAYLRRILQNLIGNAIRYTERGRVLVTARPMGPVLRLQVRDSGPGIPQSEQSNVFKEFHRLNARASASEGMGLGLAIVERACDLLGHPLYLRSVPGRGSCFGVDVPILRPPIPRPLDLASEPQVLPETAADNAADRIVFLIEPEGPLRAALVLLLEGWGVHVIEAASGTEAVALLADLGILPDVFLVDQRLDEGGSGFATAEALVRAHPRVPVRLMSAGMDAGLLARCEAAGVGILRKPIGREDLQQLLSSIGTPPLTTKVS